MFSFKERLDSFKNWPKEYSSFIARLAVMGQYSPENASDTTKLETCCFYCQHRTSNWSSNEIPLMNHFALNKDCPLFKIQTKVGRRQVIPKTRRTDESDRLIEWNFIQFSIAGEDRFFCARCGSVESKHRCAKKIQRIGENMTEEDIAISDFYIQFLNGNFNHELLCHLEVLSSATAVLGEEQKGLLVNFTKEFGLTLPFLKLKDYLEICANEIYKDLEKRMKKIEKEACDSIYNDSMIIL